MMPFVVAAVLAAVAALVLQPVNAASSDASVAHTPVFSDLDVIMNKGVETSVFPGAVAVVAKFNPDSEFTVVYRNAVGAFGYRSYEGGDYAESSVKPETIFDLASVTKVVATTSAAMLLVQNNLLKLDDLVASDKLLGPEFAAAGKGNITIQHLLNHNAGFPPDPNPNYWAAAFGCPATSTKPPPLDFSCRQKIWDGLMAQTLAHPTGSKFVYSDLSMITLMYVIGRVVANNKLVGTTAKDSTCGFDGFSNVALPCVYLEYLNENLFGPLKMTSTTFRPPAALKGSIMPTWFDKTYQTRMMQGFVSDGNAYALGGIAGHAGLFSNVDDLLKLTQRLVLAPENPTDKLFSHATVALFTKASDPSFSSRALGWDTMAPNSDYMGCGNMSAATYTHTGYTGTQICIDPDHQVLTILLTNRCFPDDSDASKTLIHNFRKEFNSYVVSIINTGKPQPVSRSKFFIALLIIIAVAAIGLTGFAVWLYIRRDQFSRRTAKSNNSLVELDRSFASIPSDDEGQLLQKNSE